MPNDDERDQAAPGLELILHAAGSGSTPFAIAERQIVLFQSLPEDTPYLRALELRLDGRPVVVMPFYEHGGFLHTLCSRANDEVTTWDYREDSEARSFCCQAGADAFPNSCPWHKPNRPGPPGRPSRYRPGRTDTMMQRIDVDDDVRFVNGHIVTLGDIDWYCRKCGHRFDALVDAELFRCGDPCVHRSSVGLI